ncbi:MAG: hypothetical protein PWP65_287 [Clostridia bacterium]|nr:hypothetical protein [Clostridia bacterium]
MHAAARAICAYLSWYVFWRVEQYLALACILFIVVVVPGETRLAAGKAEAPADTGFPGFSQAETAPEPSAPEPEVLPAKRFTAGDFVGSDPGPGHRLLPARDFTAESVAGTDPAPGFRALPIGPPGVLNPPEYPPEPKGKKGAALSQSTPLRSGSRAGRMVALTFDDGPFPMWTEKYMQVLAREKVNATFFLVGSQVKEHPELASALVSAGHEVASHSWRHARLARMKKEDEVVSDLREANTALEKATGKPVKLFRPPYGDWNPALLQLANGLGLKVVTWNVDPRDWTNPERGKLVGHILEKTEPGSIIVLHEGRPNTLAALPEIIAGLRRKGLELVTISSLISSKENEENIAK